MKKILAIIFIIAVLFTGISVTANAQCAMCRASATSNLANKDKKVAENTKNAGAGLNKGILYLMGMPYLLGGLGAFFYWRKRKQIRAFLNGEPA